MADVSPAYSQVRYVVRVESDASEEEVLRALDEADARSPYLALFREPQDVRRQVVLAARG